MSLMLDNSIYLLDNALVVLSHKMKRLPYAHTVSTEQLV